MDVPCKQATCKDVLGIKIEEQSDEEEIIHSVEDDSFAPVISNITSAGIKIESVCSYAEDNIKVEECDVYVPERPGLATQGRDIEDNTTSEQVAVKCEHTECSSEIEEQTDAEEIVYSVIDDSLAPVTCEIASADIKTEPVCSYDEDNIKLEEHDACVRERTELASQGRDDKDTTSSEAHESEQVTVKCEQTERIANCDQTEDRSSVKTKVGIMKHIRVHSGDIPSKGDVSTKHLSSIQINRVHTGDKYKCDVCMKCFKRKYSLTTHYRIHTGEKPFKCDVCMKCFHVKDYLIKHSKTHTGEKQFKCDVCNKYFITKDQLIRHNSIHTGEKPFKCDVCMKSFNMKDHLIKHSKTHTREKPFKCDVCIKFFITKDQLIRHNSIHTGEKPFKCDVCIKCFITKDQLIRHNSIHTGEKPFKCDVCMKSFNMKDYLIKHSKTHTLEKSFKCDVCIKFFITKDQLIRHNSIHTGEKPFKCDVCMKCFNMKNHLIKHSKTHTTVKPFKCDVCMKCFSYKSELTGHNRIHTGEKPFKCNICMKCFISKSALIKHIRTHISS